MVSAGAIKRLIPRVLIVRVYPKFVRPMEPNRFKFAVVAIVYKNGNCFVKGLTYCDIKKDDIVIGGQALKCYGARKLEWVHNLEHHTMIL